MNRECHTYPKVLIVNGEPFTTRSATGLTLMSLFRGWPKDRLSCLYAANVAPAPGICGQYWRLSPANLPLARVLYRVIRKPVASASAMSDSGQRGTAGEHWSDRAIFTHALRRAANVQYIAHVSRYQVPNEMLDEIKDYRPQILYSMLGANLVTQLVLDVQRHVRVPVVPHFMDDWPLTSYRGSLLRPILRYRLRRNLAEILRRGQVRLTIGDEMSTEFARRYGGNFTAFMNAVEPEYLRGTTSEAGLDAGKVQLVYVGGLHLNRWRSLRDIASALVELRREGVEAELVVHTQERFRDQALRLVVPDVVRIGGALDAAEVAPALRRAHILVHVESFDRQSRRYARYSVSTKVPECMGSGRPIFAYGPGELASIKYIVSSGAGVAVGSRDARLLVGELRALITSASSRSRLGARGLAVARQRHDALEQRERFRAMLASAAGLEP